MPLRVGIDLVSVAGVADALHAHGDRYLQRVYTERELADCRSADGVDVERLAARFAAKEAAMKVLRPGDEAVPWVAIEVVRDVSGWVAIRLHGRAAELATEAGLGELEVSLTHEAGMAAAVVVAIPDSRDRGCATMKEI